MGTAGPGRVSGGPTGPWRAGLRCAGPPSRRVSGGSGALSVGGVCGVVSLWVFVVPRSEPLTSFLGPRSAGCLPGVPILMLCAEHGFTVLFAVCQASSSVLILSWLSTSSVVPLRAFGTLAACGSPPLNWCLCLLGPSFSRCRNTAGWDGLFLPLGRASLQKPSTNTFALFCVLVALLWWALGYCSLSNSKR